MFFQVLNIIILLIAIALILYRNLVYAVLLLISLFFFASFLFFLLGFDFLALSLLIIYVGAVAVLFLFVIMTVDLKTSIQQVPAITKNSYLFKFFFIIGVLILDFYLSNFLLNYFLLKNKNICMTYQYFSFSDFSLLNSISQVLYNVHFISFIVAGYILLVAMLGAILLCLNANILNKQQYVPYQMSQDHLKNIRYKKLK